MHQQPPPRGCVLKHFMTIKNINDLKQPPPRGCVLKRQAYNEIKDRKGQPPPRGCVLKLELNNTGRGFVSSRLRAAVC